MKKVAKCLFFLIALLVPRATIGETVFHHTAETSPIFGYSPNNSPYLWHEGQSLVTRSQDVKKSGSWSLKHQATTPSTQDPQTGKVIKWLDPWVGVSGSPIQNNVMYISNWYYFSSAGGFSVDPNNWEIWKNHYEFKGNNSLYRQSSSPTVEAGVKIGFSMNYYNGKRRWFLGINSAKYVASATSRSQTDFPLNYFSNYPQIRADKPNTWVDQTFEVPLDEWVFLECYFEFKQTNGLMRCWTGKASEGKLHLLWEFSDPLFNTLTTFNNSVGKWSTNLDLYWAMGNYLSKDSPAGTYTLYTDDARISSTRIGPTLPEFAAIVGTPVVAPSNLSVKVQ